VDVGLDSILGIRELVDVQIFLETVCCSVYGELHHAKVCKRWAFR